MKETKGEEKAKKVVDKRFFASDESRLQQVTVGGLKCGTMLACLSGRLCSPKRPHGDTIR